ncbi:MAG: patatin-like phospholipase family protein [Acetobacteraceae bacterium]
MTGRLATLLCMLVLMLSGCSSLSVPDTTPLPESKLLPPGSETISRGGYRLSSFRQGQPESDRLILVAMSGGGKRSAAFSYGVLKGMRAMPIPTPNGPRPLLDELDAISGVSGGSFTAAYYGLHRDQMFGQYEKDFLYVDTNAYIFGIYLLPWNWGWLTNPLVGTNDYMARIYNRTMFHDATFQDLQKRGRPLIAIGATDISYGTPVLFTQEMFDLICSDLAPLPLASAVAASNGFPGLFSPVTLTNRRAACGDRVPGWLRRVSPADRANPLSRLGAQARTVEVYLDPQKTKYVHMADGGIADNLGMRVAGSLLHAMTLAPEVFISHGLGNLRRVTIISVDGQGVQNSAIAQQRVVGGLLSLFGLVSGGQIDRFNFETMVTVNDQLELVAKALRNARCSHVPPIDGRRCDDVRADLIHVSLAGIADGPEKERLLAIPTGLTLRRDDVDGLIAAGETAVQTNAALLDFISSLAPIQDVPARVAQAATRKP